jgi:hypothetical protein
MTKAIEQNRDLLARHAEKDLPTSDIAAALLDVADDPDAGR